MILTIVAPVFRRCDDADVSVWYGEVYYVLCVVDMESRLPICEYVMHSCL